ncbi:N-acetylmuramoyl-L-alanine amidase [Paractinoplanes rishiriensis]|uniref:Peptidoglycan recognition protein family domain-containing protein n=1 Tax=Paractinoplanes rishiriensis TaxID=1050105 RepID=A0A919MUZ6_9ACTN|nr:N-acetylmuramoyl-L-alanine amidase [Actinoplanes rishiriensis]GIE93095.1 hypothetical protein Ari01nite_05600 [Actinoplanes rishiriensis]
MHRNRTKGTLLAALLATVAALPADLPAAAAEPQPPAAVPALETIPLPASLPARPTRPFRLVGLTWADPRAALDAAVWLQVREAATGRWGEWRRLETDGAKAGDQRGASDPLWVGRADAVAARIDNARGPLPTDLRLDLINPDAPAPARREESATQQAEPRLERRAAVPMPARPVPRMVTRAGWGANEAIVRAKPTLTGPIQVFFVHHTASGNGYSCGDSASIVRGIQAFHVRSRGWDDIGYNFLVDRCGTIFEGRAGGVGRSVLGAHTQGFNQNAAAIAAIGTYDSAGVSPTVRTAIATVAAYKLGAFGNAPNGRVVYPSAGSNKYPAGAKAVLYRISGHRDAGRTECPGNGLYAQLPAIRAIAGAGPSGLRLLRMTGATRYGSLMFTRGLIRPLWNVTTPSALINRFEVYVDGRLALAAPGHHRTASLSLTPGGHTVTVRAMHLSGRTAQFTSEVVADPNAPIFASGPDVVLRAGSLDGSVPIRLNWHATDVNGLSSVSLVRPSTVDLGATNRYRNGTIKPAVPTTFTVRATDRAGNAVSASVTRTPMVLSEAAARRSGNWRALSNPAYLGGVALGATSAGASASWTFTGRSAALAVGRGALSGRVRIWVDGADQGVVDLGSPKTIYRQAIWSRWWSQSGEHTVRVEVEGTPGRPGVVLDGLVYLK